MKEKDTKNPKFYIFDFDGVLGDTFSLYLSFIQKQLHLDENRSRHFLEYEIMENRRANPLVRFLENLYYKGFVDYVKACKEDLRFRDKIAEIKLLKGQKAILSGNMTDICKHILGEDQKQFEYILGRDNTKSKIEGINFLQKHGGFDILDCVFFTDTTGDILEVSKVLRLDQIYAVSWGFQSKTELETVLPKAHIIDSFEVFLDKNI